MSHTSLPTAIDKAKGDPAIVGRAKDFGSCGCASAVVGVGLDSRLRREEAGRGEWARTSGHSCLVETPDGRRLAAGIGDRIVWRSDGFHIDAV